MAILATFRSKNGHIGHLRGSVNPSLVHTDQECQIHEFDMPHGLYVTISILGFLRRSFWPLLGLKMAILATYDFFYVLISFGQPYKIDSMPLYSTTKKFSDQYCKALKMSSVGGTVLKKNSRCARQYTCFLQLYCLLINYLAIFKLYTTILSINVILYVVVHIIWSLLNSTPEHRKKVLLPPWKSIVPPSATSYHKKSIVTPLKNKNYNFYLNSTVS